MTTITAEGMVPRDGGPPSAGIPPQPAAVGGLEPYRRVVRIKNPLGLHLRAADRFARAAKRYACAVTVLNGDLRADGKDMWALIGLVVFPDSDVILEVDGTDAAAALDPLAEILGAPTGEDYTI